MVAVSTLGVKREKDFFLQGYQEMLRRIEPEAVICYSTPFAEMEGNVIPIDYGETNNLKPKKKTWYAYAKPNEAKGIAPPQRSQSTWYLKKTNIVASGSYPVVKQSGYVITTGFGSGRVRGDREDTNFGEITQGQSRASKTGKPDSTNEQVDNNGKVKSRTKYGKNGKPKYRDDFSGRSHYDKNTGQYLDRHRTND